MLFSLHARETIKPPKGDYQSTPVLHHYNMLREATVITETAAVLAGNLYGRELALDLEGKLCTSLRLWRAQYGKRMALWDCLPMSTVAYHSCCYLCSLFAEASTRTRCPCFLVPIHHHKQTPNLLSLAMPCLPFPLCPNRFKPVQGSPNELKLTEKLSFCASDLVNHRITSQLTSTPSRCSQLSC